tara:strand:- start:359 stop:679 length:321 start_codon:yes stop_codon:yes gene_type:complete
MKITKSQLKEIIKEELKRVLSEGWHQGINDEWGVQIEVDYNRDPVLEWTIDRGQSEVARGNDASLRPNTLEAAVEKILNKISDSESQEKLRSAYSEAMESLQDESA